MDIVTKISEYENGLLQFDEMVEMYQYLVDSGMIMSLQGHYHHTANYLLQEGYITFKD